MKTDSTFRILILDLIVRTFIFFIYLFILYSQIIKTFELSSDLSTILIVLPLILLLPDGPVLNYISEKRWKQRVRRIKQKYKSKLENQLERLITKNQKVLKEKEDQYNNLQKSYEESLVEIEKELDDALNEDIGEDIDNSDLLLFSAMINPSGNNPRKESVTLLNTAHKTIDLDEWSIQDKAGRITKLSGEITGRKTKTISINGNQSNVMLSNSGGDIYLYHKNKKIEHVHYSEFAARQKGTEVYFLRGKGYALSLVESDE
jgi:hypothetical protein